MNYKHHATLSLMALCLLIASCGTNVELKTLSGTIEEPLGADSMPQQVMQAMNKALKYHQFEIFSDTVNNVSVSGIGEADSYPTEGYGIVIVKNAVSTTLPNIRNTRQPKAFYDSAKDELWLTSSAVEGTGVQVERLYQLHFKNDSAVVVATIDPYDIQQAFLQKIGYATESEQITLYIDNKPATTVTNTVTDMGGFDDDALWIGDNITYDLGNGQPRVCVTPGVKFITGLVLHYDDTPTISAAIEMDENGKFALSDMKMDNASDN